MAPSAPPRADRSLAALGVFVAGLILYVVTLAPGLLWGGGDFATYQTRAYTVDVFSQMTVFDHSLWVLLAHPFTWLPIKDVAWRANFASAVFAALALLFFYLSAGRVTRSQAPALLATAALAVSHTFWTYAVLPKVYSLNALLLATSIYLLLKWRETGRNRFLFVFAFLFGISPLNHLVMLVTGLGFGLFVILVTMSRRSEEPVWRPLLGAAGFFLIGLSPYVVLSAAQGAADTTSGTIAHFLGGLLYTLANPAAFWMAIEWGVLLGAYQFPLTGLIGIMGIVVLWRRDRPVLALIAGAIAGTVAFLVAAADPGPGNVYVWNLHYYLQAYVPFGLALAAGFDQVWHWRWFTKPLPRVLLAVVTVLLPVLVYLISPSLVRRVWADVPDFRPLPGRDNFVYVLSPWKQQETGARTFGESIMDALPPDSVLFADYSIWAVLHYMQVVEQARLDVTLVNLGGVPDQLQAITALQGSHPVYLADTYRYYDLDRIQTRYGLVPEGPIYRLAEK